MIRYGDRYVFASAPRMGTTYFLKAMAMVGFKEGFKAHAHNPIETKGPADFVITLVRHPVHWLRSYYQALKGGKCGVSIVDELAMASREAEDFSAFVRTYLKKHAGHVGEIVAAYKADSVFRVEDFPWNLLEWFDSLGIHKSVASKIRFLTPQNVWKGEDPPLSKRLRNRVLEAESDLCELYEYA